jgi:calcium-dependent protein kinase
MNVLVKCLDVKELTDLRQMFKELDTAHTGTLTADELEAGLSKAGITAAKDEIHQIIQNIDYLGNGEINYSEFLAATFQSKFKITEEHLWTVFKRFDTDNSGFIT